MYVTHAILYLMLVLYTAHCISILMQYTFLGRTAAHLRGSRMVLPWAGANRCP